MNSFWARNVLPLINNETLNASEQVLQCEKKKKNHSALAAENRENKTDFLSTHQCLT